MQTRGKFIVLEGIDGSGTTLQTQAIAQALRSRGHAVLETHEPTNDPIGAMARSALSDPQGRFDPTTLALLFAADRIDHVRSRIEPALAEGTWVLSDRYVMSSWVYQSLDNDQTWVREINRHAPWPDLTVVIDVPVDVALARVEGRTTQPREIFETQTIQETVAAGYAQLLSQSLPQVVVVSGTQSPQAVTREILAAIEAHLAS